jgi:hypothetical protein
MVFSGGLPMFGNFNNPQHWSPFLIESISLITHFIFAFNSKSASLHLLRGEVSSGAWGTGICV